MTLHADHASSYPGIVPPAGTRQFNHPVVQLIISAVVLGFLISTFMPPLIWSGNEEHYLMLSYRRFAPEGFTSNSVVFHDTTKARFLADFFMGSIVSPFDYETAHTLLLIFMSLAYGITVAYLFYVLGLTLSQGIILLYIFQAIEPRVTMGGEWLFRGVESKTMAYAAVITALAATLEGRWRLALACAVLATYLHFLVGGFWFGVLLFVYFYLHQDIRNAMMFGGIYAACVFPQLILLISEQVSGAPLRSIDGLTADYIYSIIRNPHHVAPFRSEQAFWADWALPILATVVCASACSQLLKIVKGPRARALVMAVLGVCAYLLLALIVSYFDRETGVFGKFVPFRPAAFGFFLFLVAAWLAIKESTSIPAWAAAFVTPVAIFLLGSSLLSAINETKEALAHEQEVQLSLEPVAAKLAASAADAVVLIDPKLDSEQYTNLPRLLRHPTLVGRKFMPSTRAAIIRWRDLMSFRKHLFSRGCTSPMQHQVDFILVSMVNRPAAEIQTIADTCGKAVVTTERYLLVRVAKKLKPDS